MKKILLTAFLLCIAFSFYGCPNNDIIAIPVPVDPCQVYKDSCLKIIYRFYVYDTIVENDTILEGTVLNFLAEGMGYYEWDWHIGYDTTKIIKKSFSLQFRDAVGYVPITLIAKRPPLPDCNDDGIDTVNSFIYVKDYFKASILGKYYGTHSDTVPPYIVEFYVDSKKMLRVNNINFGCADTIPNLHLFNSSSVSNNLLEIDCQSTQIGCYAPRGKAVVSRDLKSIIINYTARFKDTIKSSFTFKGVRI
jgi:hypothetical protein